MRFSDHFIRDRQERPDRREISIEMCERVKAEPMSEKLQENGRTALWGYVAERDHYLKVIVEPDGEEITTAHWGYADSNVGRKGERRSKKTMELTYWKDTDTMRISFRDDLEGYDSEEISPGIVVDFAKGGELVGIEVYEAASAKLDLSNFVLKRREKDGIDARFDIGTGFLLRDSEEVRSA